MPPSLDSVKEEFKLMRVTFYMMGGHKVTTDHVKKITMGRNFETGKYNSYSIEWAMSANNDLFSLSVPDVVAVTSEDM